ncbi:MAG: riboflavin biosynthesis protein RibD [Clostridiaceae bacterium]|nr:riboflavin biosynthesis protein RibD [Clostridiaceae bacterium]
MDKLYMERAIELAKNGSGLVNPGPLSGAVIVKNKGIISEAYLKSYDTKPAEVLVLEKARSNSLDAEMYLNIEPQLQYCKEIIKSGIKKVCIGIEDPISKGRAINELRKSGILVYTDILKDKCEELNEIYIHYMIHGTPFVFTNWAMTLDGKLATKTGDSKWISGDESLEFVHYLRQRVAAIMVGENTVRLDNPRLTTRLEGIETSNPLRVILSKYGNLPDNSNVLHIDEKTKTLIVCSTKIPREREEQLRNKKVDILKLEEKSGRIQFKDILKSLGERKIDSLYIEGGSGVLGSAFDSGIVNKVYAAVAPKIVGGNTAVTPVGGIGIEKMSEAIILSRVSHEVIGEDVIIKGYIDK